MKNKFTINDDSKDVHPVDRANYLSQFFFCWQIPLIIKYRKNEIKDSEFLVPPKKHDPKVLGDKFEKIWNQELATSKNPSFGKAITRLFFTEIALDGILFFIFDIAATLLQPLYLGKLLDYFFPNQTSISQQQACVYGSVIIFSIVLRVVTFHFINLLHFEIGMKMRMACNSLIFRTILKSNKTTIHKITLGKLINLLSNDIDKLDRAVLYMQYLWICSGKILIATYFLYIWIGYPAVAGAAVMTIFMILQCYVLRIASKRKKDAASKTDYRIRIMSNIVTGIQAIKMYGWEKPFGKLATEIRRKELKCITRTNQLQNLNYTLASYVHKVSIYIFFLLLPVVDFPINAREIFMTINIYDLLKQSCQFAVLAINLMSEIKTLFKRITQVLVIDNIDNSKEHQNGTDVYPDCKIFIKNLNAKWDSSLPNNTLNNVHFQLSPGKLVAIVGPAGSGKSTLLQVILKETSIKSGTLYTKGTISYAPQEPWVFPATIRENIIFGEKPNENKFLKVIRICALEHDISLFPYGPNTLVGERGVMLSGGQKARVSLARAIYRDADIYLLDDPLSAVDSNVAHQIFTECILGYLSNKSVVLVTHQLQFLQNMDMIYILENGEVQNCGKYEELETLVGKSLQKYEEKNVVAPEVKFQKFDIQSEVKENDGRSKVNTYKSYFFAGGYWKLLCFNVFLIIFSQFFMSTSDAFVSFWIDLKKTIVDRDSNFLKFFTGPNCLYTYTGLFLAIIILYHLFSWTFVQHCKKISLNLHEPLLDKTLHGSMKFFDSHYSGQIFNRFSRDMGVIDETLPRFLYQLIRQISTVLGVFVMVVTINIWIIIPTIFLFGCVYGFFKKFLPTINRFKRVTAIRKSPLLTHVTSTIQGLTVIKAFNAQNAVLSKFDDCQSYYNSIENLERAVYVAYAYWVDIACTLYNAAIIFFFILCPQDNSIGIIGLTITQSLLLIMAVQYTMRMYGETDSQMISVNRITNYSDLVSEDDTSTVVPPESWPTEGNITFDLVSMRYSIDQPYVLKQINLNIKSGEKIGIVGRTGSGKSSLISTLFRLYDFEGRIIIDNIDINSVHLSTLRSKLSVIPQDPVLFLGTLRSNLDPFNQFDDSQLWNALEDVKLKKLIENLPQGLESPVLESGANFSVGEKQMICLVRAILRDSKIVVLDEATANVDLYTDQLIQATIKKKFKKSTVIMIAHRLETVMDCDKICVMDAGRVVEFDTKEKLLENQNGHFYRLVYQT